jgi:hypothetical protein
MTMLNSKARTVLAAAFTGAFVVGFSLSATAGTRWQENHPWRTQVNHRLGNLNARINQERREGELSRGQAAALHSEVHGIRQAERAMAAGHDTHLSRGEWNALNQQENTVGRQVGR